FPASPRAHSASRVERSIRCPPRSDWAIPWYPNVTSAATRSPSRNPSTETLPPARIRSSPVARAWWALKTASAAGGTDMGVPILLPPQGRTSSHPADLPEGLVGGDPHRRGQVQAPPL